MQKVYAHVTLSVHSLNSFKSLLCALVAGNADPAAAAEYSRKDTVCAKIKLNAFSHKSQ